MSLGPIHAELGDARVETSLDFMGASIKSRVGTIVTSPPYATALPYIDTDRLSLVALGLAADDDLCRLDEDLIGSREINTTDRREFERQIDGGLALPSSTAKFLKWLRRRVIAAGDHIGFRRRNMPSVLARYFIGIDACAQNWARVCGRGAFVAIVIGDSRTRIKEWIEIPTRDLISEILESRGFRSEGRVDLTNQPAYSIHRANVIREESVLLHTFDP
jgi:hypothetical protein